MNGCLALEFYLIFMAQCLLQRISRCPNVQMNVRRGYPKTLQQNCVVVVASNFCGCGVQEQRLDKYLVIFKTYNLVEMTDCDG